MATFTYVAKRNILGLGWGVSGTDLSVDAASQEFRSTSTDLAGLEAGHSVLISGFSNAENNGWHEVAASGEDAIVVLTATLVDEIAGEPVQILGYAHGAGQAYSIEIAVARLDPDRQIIKHIKRAQSGDAETLRVRADRLWSLTTDWISPSDQPLWTEFLTSVEAGEIFEFDPYGTIDDPDRPRIVESLDDAITPQRVGRTGKITYTLNLRETGVAIL